MEGKWRVSAIEIHPRNADVFRSQGASDAFALVRVKLHSVFPFSPAFQQLGESALRSTDYPNDLKRWGLDTVEKQVGWLLWPFEYHPPRLGAFGF
jgi:hypothetical protein